VIRHKEAMGRDGRAQQARFECLYREHAGNVLAYARRRVSSAEEANDVVAETFLHALRRFDDLKDDNALPWLYAIAWRVLSTQRRAHARQQAIARKIMRQQPAGLAAVDDASPVALRAFARLSEPDREILTLSVFEELSSGEVAQVLGCSSNACRIRLHRARRRLRARVLELEPDAPNVRLTSGRHCRGKARRARGVA